MHVSRTLEEEERTILFSCSCAKKAYGVFLLSGRREGKEERERRSDVIFFLFCCRRIKSIAYKTLLRKILSQEKRKRKKSKRRRTHTFTNTHLDILNQSKYLEFVSISSNMSVPTTTSKFSMTCRKEGRSSNSSFPLGQEIYNCKLLEPIFPECFGCKLSINDPSFLSVSPGIHWHDECLRCRLCKQKLDERTTCFMDRHGFPYCKHDYPRYNPPFPIVTLHFSCRRFFSQCSACQKNLLRNDLIQRAKSNMYHVDCFRCEACRKCLQTGDGKTLIRSVN